MFRKGVRSTGDNNGASAYLRDALALSLASTGLALSPRANFASRAEKVVFLRFREGWGWGGGEARIYRASDKRLIIGSGVNFSHSTNPPDEKAACVHAIVCFGEV